jgi:hypothetical protein
MRESDSSVEFAILTMEGPRFEAKGMPVDGLSEIMAYREVIVGVAHALFYRQNPGRKRLPRGFDDSFQLRLDRIDDGSAVNVLDRVSSGHDAGDVFDQARDLIEGAISSANLSEELSDDFPSDCLTLFERFGKSLRDDEAFKLQRPYSDRVAIFDPESRKRLLLLRSDSYTSERVLYGHVFEVNADSGSFQIRLDSGQSLPSTLPEGYFEDVRGALSPGDAGALVRVEGIAQLDRSDTLRKMEEISQFDLVPPAREDERFQEADMRLDEFSNLEDGWYGNGTLKPTQVAVKKAHEILDVFARENALVPRVYPMPTGGVQFEWNEGRRDVSLEIHADASAALFDVALDSDEMIEVSPITIEQIVKYSKRIS